MKLLDNFYKNGGLILLSHKNFSSMINKHHIEEPENFFELVEKIFLDPGPDLVIIDEGNEIKNEKNQLSLAIKRIRTRRRIVLSGTPLQNNLKEYFSICNFVR